MCVRMCACVCACEHAWGRRRGHGRGRACWPGAVECCEHAAQVHGRVGVRVCLQECGKVYERAGVHASVCGRVHSMLKWVVQGFFRPAACRCGDR